MARTMWRCPSEVHEVPVSANAGLSAGSAFHDEASHFRDRVPLGHCLVNAE